MNKGFVEDPFNTEVRHPRAKTLTGFADLSIL